MKVAVWLIGAMVLFCGVGVYVKAPQDLHPEIPVQTVLYIGNRTWQEPWVDTYCQDSEALPAKLAETEYRYVVIEPQDADCRELLDLLQRTQPLAQTILLGNEDLRILAGEYRMDYRYYQKDGEGNDFRS